MTVVRNEFESGENNPLGVLFERVAVDRVPLAQLRQVHDRRARRHRERADRAAAGVLQDATTSPTTRCSIVAGKFDEAEDARRSSTSTFGAIPQPAARRCRRTYTERADAGRRAHGHAAPRRRRAGRRAPSTTCPPGAHPDFAAVDVLAHVLGDAPVGPAATRRWSRRRRPRSVCGFDFQLHDPGIAVFGAEVRAGPVARRRARRRCSQTVEAVGASAAHRGGGRARAQRSCSRTSSCTLNDSERVGLALSRVDRRWATGGCSSCTATALRQVTADGRAARRGARTSSRRTARSALFIPTDEARPRRDSRRRPTSPRCSRTTRATRPSPRARPSTRRPRTSRRATQRATLPGGIEARAAAEEDARRRRSSAR